MTVLGKIDEKIQAHEHAVEVKKEEKKDEKAEAVHAEQAKKASAPAPAPANPATDALSFAIIDCQRGVNQLRQNSAASVAGTWVHTAILYFDAAIARLDRSLGLQRPGVRLSAEDRARERTRYEHEYVDPTLPRV
jgi:hypothetical protein